MTDKVSPLVAIITQLILDDKLSNILKTIKKPREGGVFLLAN